MRCIDLRLVKCTSLNSQSFACFPTASYEERREAESLQCSCCHRRCKCCKWSFHPSCVHLTTCKGVWSVVSWSPACHSRPSQSRRRLCCHGPKSLNRQHVTENLIVLRAEWRRSVGKGFLHDLLSRHASVKHVGRALLVATGNVFAILQTRGTLIRGATGI